MIEEDYSELDSLNEKDVLEALNGSGFDISQNNFPEQKSISSANKDTGSVQISGTNTGDLAQLLSNLLSNKTVEITIKIKD